MTFSQERILVLLVEDKPGVLNRVASLLRRRNFNIESIAVGHSHQPHLSGMTIVVKGDNASVEQVRKQLDKLIEVVKVVDITEDNPVASAGLMIQRASDNWYWNGSSWQASQTWVPAPVGGSAPTFTFSYDSSAIARGDQYTVTARATDGDGNTGTSGPITYTIQTTAPVAAAPSVSVWGVIAMAAVLAGSLVWLLRRRATA